jgi:aquaporin Z
MMTQQGSGPALFAGGDYIAQLWLFWLAPLLGAALAGLLCRSLYESENIIDTIVVEERRVS